MSNIYIFASWIFYESNKVFVDHSEKFVTSTDIMAWKAEGNICGQN